MISEAINLGWWLLIGHAVADFALQTDSMAKGKNRNRPVDMSVVPPGQKYQPTWGYWLTAHALIHGAAVCFATGYTIIGMAEALCHWLIDFGKCENKYGIHVDQALHVLCKILWILWTIHLSQVIPE